MIAALRKPVAAAWMALCALMLVSCDGEHGVAPARETERPVAAPPGTAPVKPTAALVAALKAAKDEDAKTAVVRKLLDRRGAEVGEALSWVIENEDDEDAKGRIVTEIAKGTTPDVIELLKKIYNVGDDGLFTGPAAEALVKIPGDEMSKMLAEGFKNQSTECASASVADALAKRKDKAITEALLWAIEDLEPTWQIARARVIAGLGGRKDRRATEALLDSIENAEYDGAREAAAQALALEDGTKVTAALVKALATDETEEVRVAAAESLGRRRRARQAEREAITAEIEKILAKEKADDVKKAIAGALAVKGPAAKP